MQLHQHTSPIMTAFSASTPISANACWKKLGSGFPTIVEVVSAAYSKAVANGPGPNARPSPRLKYRALCTAINGQPSSSNLKRKKSKANEYSFGKKKWVQVAGYTPPECFIQYVIIEAIWRKSNHNGIWIVRWDFFEIFTSIIFKKTEWSIIIRLNKTSCCGQGCKHFFFIDAKSKWLEAIKQRRFRLFCGVCYKS